MVGLPREQNVTIPPRTYENLRVTVRNAQYFTCQDSDGSLEPPPATSTRGGPRSA